MQREQQFGKSQDNSYLNKLGATQVTGITFTKTLAKIFHQTTRPCASGEHKVGAPNFMYSVCVQIFITRTWMRVYQQR